MPVCVVRSWRSLPLACLAFGRLRPSLFLGAGLSYFLGAGLSYFLGACAALVVSRIFRKSPCVVSRARFSPRRRRFRKFPCVVSRARFSPLGFAGGSPDAHCARCPRSMGCSLRSRSSVRDRNLL